LAADGCRLSLRVCNGTMRVHRRAESPDGRGRGYCDQLLVESAHRLLLLESKRAVQPQCTACSLNTIHRELSTRCARVYWLSSLHTGDTRFTLDVRFRSFRSNLANFSRSHRAIQWQPSRPEPQFDGGDT